MTPTSVTGTRVVASENRNIGATPNTADGTKGSIILRRRSVELSVATNKQGAYQPVDTAVPTQL